MQKAVPAQNGKGLKPLTFREGKFVDKYFETHFNGAEAARLAGYSKKAAKVQAARLLTKANLLCHRSTEEGPSREDHDYP